MSNTDFVGVWMLESLELRSSSGEPSFPLGPEVRGALVYTADGYMSVEIMRPGRKRYASNDGRAGTVEEMVEAVRGYISYCGRYEVKQDRVVHHVEISLFPNWISEDLVRLYRIDGDRLLLDSVPYLVEGKQQTAHLVWRKKK